jgi:putative toxin-antitoxin system antitoxin component (TIGR02293 family)
VSLDFGQMAVIFRQMATPSPAAKAFRQYPFGDDLKMSKIVLSGLPSKVLRQLAAAFGIPIADMGAFVHIKERTLMRRIEANALLKPDESERAARLMRIYTRAVDVLADEDKAKSWLNRPLRVLDNQSPLTVAATEPGAREVEQVLGRLEHGVFA